MTYSIDQNSRLQFNDKVLLFYKKKSQFTNFDKIYIICLDNELCEYHDRNNLYICKIFIK